MMSLRAVGALIGRLRVGGLHVRLDLVLGGMLRDPFFHRGPAVPHTSTTAVFPGRPVTSVVPPLKGPACDAEYSSHLVTVDGIGIGWS
jgi:hypothetical protein